MKTVRIIPSPLGGVINSIPSKSHAHRLLICAGLANERTEIHCSSSSEDIDATAGCLKAIGSEVIKTETGFIVEPGGVSPSFQLDCGESGSTYRFLFPVVCAMMSRIKEKSSQGRDNSYEFILHGRLPERPMDSLFDVLEAKGIRISGKGTDKVSVSGTLAPGRFTIPGNISSQFISGLIFALPLLNDESVIEITGGIESKNYVDITIAAVREFGIKLYEEKNQIRIPGNQKYISPGELSVEGDWSNAAFWLCASALSGRPITCKGLNINSLQGDKKILNILENFGVSIKTGENDITVIPGQLHGVTIDASQVPDLVPAIAAVAACAEGTSKIVNAERLRIKESDRLKSITATLSALGADISETADGLVINGRKKLSGGKVDSWGDHRIAMMAAIASAVCEKPVTIENAQAVKKSYPAFFDDFKILGGKEG